MSSFVHLSVGCSVCGWLVCHHFLKRPVVLLSMLLSEQFPSPSIHKKIYLKKKLQKKVMAILSQFYWQFNFTPVCKRLSDFHSRLGVCRISGLQTGSQLKIFAYHPAYPMNLIIFIRMIFKFIYWT